MIERYNSSENEQPPLTTFEVRILANRAVLYGHMIDLPNPQDQLRDKAMPHYYIMSIDEPRVAILRQQSEDLAAVEIEYAEPWVEEMDKEVLGPFVIISVHRNISHEVDPSLMFEKITQYFLSLDEESEHIAVDTYEHEGRRIPMDSLEALMESTRQLSDEDLQFLRRII